MMLVDIMWAERALLLALTLLNMGWSCSGFLRISKGEFFAMNLYCAAIFLYSVSNGSYQVWALLHIVSPRTDVTTAASLLLSILASSFALFAHRMQRGLRTFHFVQEHLAITLPLAKLAEVAPQRAEDIAEFCRAALVDIEAGADA